ncbi:Bax inhibitor-1/YccA family protein [Microlunatus antarcticus]|uniref:Putative YccA/Bax inhibitor family protein n=1 Tax=Microlunatus antarcticus TaxID=53388 RepID=A0A7W5P965_9ACTN|nr:Bax inhibitor-1/YccA family protein [Microlunatus antarcticus]MBB3328581.1 putative YccA/Bax inhibitor family protein [Microlunatus antarcticus]
MLRSSNPILSKKDAFTPAAPQYGQQPYQGCPGQGGGFGGPQDPRSNASQTVQGRMTLDDVITKTAVTIAVLVITAALAWNFVPDSLYFPAMILSALVGFGVVLLVSFRRVVSPALVVLYAAIEGVFIGMISKVFESVYTGIVAQAVVATFVAAGVTLAAYKFFNIRVTAKFTKIVFISTAAFAGLMLVNFIFSLVTGSGGLRSGITGPVSGLSLLVSAVAIVLAVLNLILDFDYVERGVEMGAPASESWRAAFGLTVTMVWLYIELLRLISYIRR